MGFSKFNDSVNLLTANLARYAFHEVQPYSFNGDVSSLLTIIIPCYNEANRLNPEAFLSFLAQSQITKFIFVDDGSSDSTGMQLQQLANRDPQRIECISLEKNGGKAEAVRLGINTALASGAPNVGFWDADLATPLYEIEHFISILNADRKRQMICGARVKRVGAEIERHWYRHYPGRIVATMISLLLQLPTYDTQCGAKIFRGELAREIFRQPFLSPWLFDVELIARTIGFVGRQEAVRCIYEQPLTRWRDVGVSKISLSYIPRIPFELLRISVHYRHQLKN